MGSIAEPTPTPCGATIDLNLIGTFLCIKQAVAGHERHQGTGSIIGYVVGRRTLPPSFLWAYGGPRPDRHAVASAAEELATRASGSTASARDHRRRAHVVHHRRRCAARRLPRAVAARPRGHVDDVAEAVRYLAGPESSWITGGTWPSTAATTCGRAPTTRCSSAARKADRPESASGTTCFEMSIISTHDGTEPPRRCVVRP